MQIGDMTVTREDMPSFGMTQLNPSHIEQAMQDVLMRITQNQMGAAMMAPQQAPAPNGAEQAAQGQAGGMQ